MAGAYNAVFTSQRPTGRRTGMVIDPPDGRVPPMTLEARARQAEIREYDGPDAEHHGVPGRPARVPGRRVRTALAPARSATSIAPMGPRTAASASAA